MARKRSNGRIAASIELSWILNHDRNRIRRFKGLCISYKQPKPNPVWNQALCSIDLFPPSKYLDRSANHPILLNLLGLQSANGLHPVQTQPVQTCPATVRHISR